jgi:peptidoglycan/LPS O-acetylase OafA/YrhL
MIGNKKINALDLRTEPVDSSKPLSKNIKQKNTITVLDGVRAFACFSVIAYHINYVTNNDHIWNMSHVGPVITAFALAGSSGVTLFFVLSGFLLFMPYAKSLLFDAPWPSIRRYYIRRAFRILPGYYISLALMIIVLNREYLNPDHWKQLLLFITFFMDSTRSTYQAINGPFWTLAVEWQFYLILPLLALGLRWIAQRGSLQRRLNCLGLGLLGLIAWALATRYWGHSWFLNPSQPMLLPAPLHRLALFFLYGETGKFLEDFAVGMLVCVIYIFAQQEPEHMLSQICKKYSHWIWASGILWLVFAVMWPYTPLLNPLRGYIGAHSWLVEILYATGFGLCVLALLFRPPDLRTFFEWKPVCWFGQRSYGLYIWHLPFIVLFSSYLLPLLHIHNHYMVYGSYWIFLICILIPFGYVFYRWIEQPSIKLGQWLISNRIRV